jgi:hypothetical protein
MKKELEKLPYVVTAALEAYHRCWQLENGTDEDVESAKKSWALARANLIDYIRKLKSCEKTVNMLENALLTSPEIHKNTSKRSPDGY